MVRGLVKQIRAAQIFRPARILFTLTFPAEKKGVD
jgi:hypothetical protein